MSLGNEPAAFLEQRRLRPQHFRQRFVRANFVAPTLRDSRRRTSDADGADHLIVDDDRKSSRIRKHSDQDLLQFAIRTLAHAICQSLAWFPVRKRRASFHLRRYNTEIVLTVHAVHIDMVAVIIEDVDADADSFFLRQPLARLDDAFRGCQINAGEIMDFFLRCRR
jgi:hypothetical protein